MVMQTTPNSNARVRPIRTPILLNLRFSLKNITSLLLSIQNPSDTLVLLEGHLRLDGRRVERRLVDDLFVDGARGVYYGRLDHLALDDRLHIFIYVVVSVLTSDGGAFGMCALYR